ncbi:hypothetical protein HDU67_004540, partial [Dinochytrium kinnereticum]
GELSRLCEQHWTPLQLAEEFDERQNVLLVLADPTITDESYDSDYLLALTSGKPVTISLVNVFKQNKYTTLAEIITYLQEQDALTTLARDRHSFYLCPGSEQQPTPSIPPTDTTKTDKTAKANRVQTATFTVGNTVFSDEVLDDVNKDQLTSVHYSTANSLVQQDIVFDLKARAIKSDSNRERACVNSGCTGHFIKSRLPHAVDNVGIAPDVSESVLSVWRLLDQGHDVWFDSKDKTVNIGRLGTTPLIKEVGTPKGFYIDIDNPIQPTANMASSYFATPLTDSQKWHERFGHANFHFIADTIKHKAARGLPDLKSDPSQSFCDP